MKCIDISTCVGPWAGQYWLLPLLMLQHCERWNWHPFLLGFEEKHLNHYVAFLTLAFVVELVVAGRRKQKLMVGSVHQQVLWCCVPVCHCTLPVSLLAYRLLMQLWEEQLT